MAKIILYASIVWAGGMFFVNMYNSLIDSRSWGAKIPESIVVARQYFRVINPGSFFRICSPVNQLLAAASLIFFWKAGMNIRLYLSVALAFFVITDLFTFAYFYPRLHIMFKSELHSDVETLKKAWSQWNYMNWVRSFILLAGIILSSVSLHKIYTQIKIDGKASSGLTISGDINKF